MECRNVYLDSEPNTLLVSPVIEDAFSTWPWEVRNDHCELEGLQHFLDEVVIGTWGESALIFLPPTEMR